MHNQQHLQNCVSCIASHSNKFQGETEVDFNYFWLKFFYAIIAGIPFCIIQKNAVRSILLSPHTVCFSVTIHTSFKSSLSRIQMSHCEVLSSLRGEHPSLLGQPKQKAWKALSMIMNRASLERTCSQLSLGALIDKIGQKKTKLTFIQIRPTRIRDRWANLNGCELCFL